MAVNDLNKIEEVLHSALELPEGEHRDFVAAACEGDAELFQEVMSLIELDAEAENFIEAPPDDLAADVMAERDAGSKMVGKMLDKYRVISRIGAGGMGEVFLAEDTRLDRKVALKILPSQFSSDRERELRFEQEAKAISALNHRNIITIFDIEEVDGISFMATEYVDGLTLRDKIASGPIPWRQAVDISIQIASALAAAHSVGIIHRDIKPANIMVREDGEVKVLDFGLAKLTMPSATSGSFDTRDHTAQNRVMGTINYMSPEQALGQKLDARTDIFSLGVVIYEMISGKQLFAGASDAAVYNAIINEVSRGLEDADAEVPYALDTVVRRTLAKNARDRYQTADELRDELRRMLEISEHAISREDVSRSPLAARPALSRALIPIAALLMLSASALGLYVWNSGSAPPAPAKNFRFVQLTSDGDALMPSLSPDGKTVIFSSRRSGNWDIFTQRVGGSNAVNLTAGSAADERDGVYSPNGEQIAFSSNRDGTSGIFLMEATGENVRRVSDFGHNPAWSPDGTEIVFSTTPVDDPTNRGGFPASLWIVHVASGERRELTTHDAVQPHWSPSGDRIAFWSIDTGGRRDIKTISSKGGEAVSITSDTELDWNPVWSRDGNYLYFASKRGGSMNFWRVAVNRSTGAPIGSPEPFTTPSTFSQDLSFSADGRSFAFAQLTNTSNIIQAEFQPRSEVLASKTKVIGKSSRYDRNPSISPDGQWIAFDALKDGQADLYKMRIDGTELLQLTKDAYRERAPRWSPDGSQLVFYSDRSGSNESWVMNANGSGLQQITFNSQPYGLIAFWSPDGSRMVQSIAENYGRIFPAKFPLTDQTPLQIPRENDPDIWEMPYSWSPDGNKIAQLRQATNSSMPGIVVYDLSTNRHEVVSELGDVPVWLSDSRRLIFSHENKIFLIDTVTKRTKELLALGPTDLIPGITVSPDDRSIYFSLEQRESNLWLGIADQ